MAHYTFDIIKYTLITEEGETYKDFIEMMPSLTVQATNYIAATFKAEKAYPSDKYVHQLIDTDAEKWPVNATIFSLKTNQKEKWKDLKLKTAESSRRHRNWQGP